MQVLELIQSMANISLGEASEDDVKRQKRDELEADTKFWLADFKTIASFFGTTYSDNDSWDGTDGQITDSEIAFVATALSERLNAMPRVNPLVQLHGCTLTIEQCIESLKTRQFELPTLMSGYESELLAQAGKFYHPRALKEIVFPPCKNGKECVALVHRGYIKSLLPKWQGCILTQLMFPEEYRALIKEGLQPCIIRPCILCVRQRMSEFVTLRRSDNRVKVDDMCLVQMYKNLSDCHGGYCSQYLLKPKPGVFEGFLDFLCKDRLDLLSVYVDDYNRIHIDQSALVWKGGSSSSSSSSSIESPSGLTPNIGETVQSFRKRSDNEARRQQFHSIPMSIGPMYKKWHDMALSLRDNPRSALSLYVQSKKLYGVGVAFDISAPFHVHGVEPEFESAVKGLCRDSLDGMCETECEDRCIDMHTMLSFVAFGTGSRVERNSLTMVVRKVIPQRCQTRKFNDKIKELARNPHQSVFRAIRRCVYMSLSGNMRDVGSASKPSAEDRYRLMATFLSDREDMVEISRIVLVECPQLVIFSLRELMNRCIEQDIAMKRGMSFDQGSFSQCVRKAMDVVRIHAHSLIIDARRVLAGETVDMTRPKYIYAAFSQAHRHILRIGSSGVQLSFMDVVYGVGGSVYNRSICKAKRSKRKPDRVRSVVESIKECKRYITDRMAECMQMAVVITGCYGLKSEATLLQFLVLFGVPPHMMRLLDKIREKYYAGVISKRVLQAFIKRMCVKFPFIGACVSLMSCIWKRSRMVDIYELPASYAKYQMDAISHHYKSVGDTIGIGVIPVELCCISYCSVCNTVYSLLCKEKDTYKQRYRHGYRDMLVDYDTLKGYCNRHHTCYFPYRTCADTEVRSLFALGKAIRINRQIIILCPGEKCGRPMVVDVNHSSYTERGFVCAVCTASLKATKTAAFVYSCSKLTCCVCYKENIPPSSSVFVLHGGVVCGKHYTEPMSDYVSSLTTETTPTLAVCVSQILEFIKQHKPVKAVRQPRAGTPKKPKKPKKSRVSKKSSNSLK